MSFVEQAFAFPCAGEQLLGIVALPDHPEATGILLVVGGPQYRVGSHRQFLLLSRTLAEAGYSAMRFDYRGMGDSAGELRGFESANDDIAAAIDALQARCPWVERIVLWGLCDAASASLLYWDATKDERVSGMVLLNPWARSEATLAKTHIKHYYGQRLLQIEFWHKLLSGKLGIGRALRGFSSSLMRTRPASAGSHKKLPLSFQQRMMQALEAFPGPLLLILSGNDYTGKEFLQACQNSEPAQRALSGPRLTRFDSLAADHTFSSREWRQGVEAETLAWLQKSIAP